MKKADIITSLRMFLDDDIYTPASLRADLTDNEVWRLFTLAIPQLRKYLGAWGWMIHEDQFLPYYTPETADLSIDPFRFTGNSNVTINDALYLAAAPGSGWVQTVPIYERISTEEAMAARSSDPNYKRNLYYATKLSGYVSIYDYDAAANGTRDESFYRIKKYRGILTVKVEVVTEDATGRAVGFDLSLDGGRTWIGAAVGCVFDTEIDVSAYPSSSPVIKLIVGSDDSTSPKVRDLRVFIWQVDNLEENLTNVMDLAHAIRLEGLADRAAAGEGSQELHDILVIRADRIRQRVAGRLGDGKVSIPNSSAPQVAAGPGNKYSSKFFGGRS